MRRTYSSVDSVTFSTFVCEWSVTGRTNFDASLGAAHYAARIPGHASFGLANFNQYTTNICCLRANFHLVCLSADETIISRQGCF